MKYINISKCQDHNTNQHYFKNQDTLIKCEVEMCCKESGCGRWIKVSSCQCSWLGRQIQEHAITGGNVNYSVLIWTCTSLNWLPCLRLWWRTWQSSFRREGFIWLSFSTSQWERTWQQELKTSAHLAFSIMKLKGLNYSAQLPSRFCSVWNSSPSILSSTLECVFSSGNSI